MNAKQDFTGMYEGALDKIRCYLEEGNRPEVGDMHNRLFNEDYYIIGTAEAEEELESYGTFNCIREIQSYEQDNFGEVNTDLSDPEKIVNMLFYIVGEEILYNLKSWEDTYNENILTDETAQKMIDEIKTLQGGNNE